MDSIYQSIVVNKQKAIVGFVVAFIATYLAKFGFDLETLTVKELLEQVAYGLIGYVSVYVKRNQ